VGSIPTQPIMNKSFETFTRVTIIGQHEELADALLWCAENGFKVLRNGPVPSCDAEGRQHVNAETGPVFDLDKFKIFAETKGTHDNH